MDNPNYGELIAHVNAILDKAAEYFKPESLASVIVFNHPGGSYRLTLEKVPGWKTVPAGNSVFIPLEPSGQRVNLFEGIPVKFEFKQPPCFTVSAGPTTSASIGGLNECGCPPGHPCCPH